MYCTIDTAVKSAKTEPAGPGPDPETGAGGPEAED